MELWWFLLILRTYQNSASLALCEGPPMDSLPKAQFCGKHFHVITSSWFGDNWHFNSSSSSVAYRHQWTGPVLLRIMACCLFGTKPLPQPTLTNCQLEPYEQTSVKFKSKYKTFHSQKLIWNLKKRQQLCPWGDELKVFITRPYSTLNIMIEMYQIMKCPHTLMETKPWIQLQPIT